MSKGVATFESRTAQATRGSNIGLLWRPLPKAPPCGRGFLLCAAQRRSDGLQHSRGHPFLLAPGFHPALEFLASGGSVLGNPVLAQQPIHAQPSGTMPRLRQIIPKTAPGIFQQPTGGRQQLGPDRSEVGVIAHGAQVAVAAPIHHQRLVMAAEDVPAKFVPVVQTKGIGTEKPAHSRHQVGLRRLDDQVEVVFHQAVGVNFKTRLLTRLGQGLEEIVAIGIVQKDRFLAIS